MDDAIENINKLLKHPDDVEDKLEAIAREVSQETSAAVAHADSEFWKRMNWFQQVKARSFENLEPFPKFTKSTEEIKLISLAYMNLRSVYTSHKRIKNIEEELRMFYRTFSDKDPSTQSLSKAHEHFYSLEDFRLRMQRCKQLPASKIEKAELDFVLFILGINLPEREDLVEAVRAIVIKEEEKDRITCVVRACVQNGAGSRDTAGRLGGSAINWARVLDEVRDDVRVEHRNPEYLQELCRMYIHYSNRQVLDLRTKVVSGIKSRVKNRVTEDYVQILPYLDSLSTESKIGTIVNVDEIFRYSHETLKRYFAGADLTDAGEVLKILEFDEKYSRLNEARALGLSKIVNTNTLLNTYCGISTEKISVWMRNIKNLIIDSFLIRDKVPAIDEEAKFVSIDFINLLELVKNQLEPTRFKVALYRRIRNHIVKEAAVLKEELTSVMESEFKDAISLKGKPGYEEYIIMVGNSGLKLAQYADDQNDLREIFVDILKSSNNLLCRFILNTCQAATVLIFTDEWYHADVTRKLVATIEDFLNDYRVRMFDYMFYTFVLSVIKGLIDVYLKQISRRRAIIYSNCPQRLNFDYEDFLELFSAFIDREEVLKRLEPLKFLIPLLEVSTVDMFIIEVRALKMRLPGLKRDFVKTLIKKKRGMDDGERQKIKEELKNVFPEEEENKKAFFSRLFK